MIYFISKDMGCVYKPSELGGEIEFTPLYKNNIFYDDFSPVEVDLVGDEIVEFEGVDITLAQVFKIIVSRFNLSGWGQ